HGDHVVAEGAGGVVVLAVDVGADGAADGDLAGARQHGDPQAVGQRGLHQLVEGDAAVDVDDGGLRVDGVDVLEGLHVHDEAAGVLRRVAVGAAHAAGDDAALEVVGLAVVLLGDGPDRGGDFGHVGGVEDLGGRGGGASPAGEGPGFCGEGSVGTVRSAG